MGENLNLQARRGAVPSFAEEMKILLVDRDVDSLGRIGSILESHSYSVTAVERATDALTIFAENNGEFDAVLVDVDMEEMSCLHFMIELSVTDDCVPVMVMSSIDKMDVANAALNQGARHYFMKPVPSTQLAQIWQYIHQYAAYKARQSRMGRDGA